MEDKETIDRFSKFANSLPRFERTFIKNLLSNHARSCDCVELTAERCIFCRTDDVVTLK